MVKIEGVHSDLQHRTMVTEYLGGDSNTLPMQGVELESVKHREICLPYWTDDVEFTRMGGGGGRGQLLF